MTYRTFQTSITFSSLYNKYFVNQKILKTFKVFGFFLLLQGLFCNFILAMNDKEDRNCASSIVKKTEKDQDQEFYRLQNLAQIHPQLHEKQTYNTGHKLTESELEGIKHIHEQLHLDKVIDKSSALTTTERFHEKLHADEERYRINSSSTYH